MAIAKHSNWHSGPKALDSYYVLSAEQPPADEGAVRVQPTFGDAVGFRDVFDLAPGFQVVTGDLTCHQEAFLTMPSDDSLKFHYRLDGVNEVVLRDRAESQMTRYCMGVLLSPPGSKKSEHYLQGEHERSVTLVCQADFLREKFGTELTELPASLRGFIESGIIEPYNKRLAMPTEAVSAATMILEAPFRGRLRRQYIEARALELLVLSLHGCARQARETDTTERGLNERDIGRVRKARQLLERDFTNPPTISELAKTIGLNEAKLMHDFKQLFGQTIFDFSQNIRMDEAKRLLETTGLSITEIAFEVGYEYSSNFTTAFKRRFGVPPSVARDAFRK